MTFKDVVIKNFKHNIKTYSSFFICSTFTITLFFIFTTLLYNNSVTTFLKDAGSGAQVVLYIALIATSVFAVFFISYVHSSMKKSRGKEFGLLMTLGMTARDLNKIIVLEDIILSAVSLFSGIFIGTLFSRLVHMLVNKLMDLQVPYSLSYKSFVFTFIAFFIIFSAVMLWGYIKTRNISISYLLKQQRSTEYTGNGSRLALTAGVVMTLLLVLDGLAAIRNRDVALNMKVTIASALSGLTGIYLLIANLFPKMLGFIKKRKKLYNRNLIMLAEVKHSMGKNKRLLYMSALLCAVIIYSFSSSLGLFSITEDIVDQSSSADIEYIEAGNINNFTEEGMNKLFREESLSLKNKEDVQCLFLKVEGLELDYPLPAVAVAESSYNKYSSGKTNVTSGSVRLSGDEINLPKVTGDTIVLQGENSRV
ncbi:MAG: ABC transporter permease, partial [Bacillota bacterium]|nr:ABC transporter permease [Bacillota bacterium]